MHVGNRGNYASALGIFFGEIHITGNGAVAADVAVCNIHINFVAHSIKRPR